MVNPLTAASPPANTDLQGEEEEGSGKTRTLCRGDERLCQPVCFVFVLIATPCPSPPQKNTRSSRIPLHQLGTCLFLVFILFLKAGSFSDLGGGA